MKLNDEMGNDMVDGQDGDADDDFEWTPEDRAGLLMSNLFTGEATREERDELLRLLRSDRKCLDAAMFELELRSLPIDWKGIAGPIC